MDGCCFGGMLLYMPRMMERYLRFPRARGRGGLRSEIEGRNSTWRPDADSRHALTKVGFRALRPANRRNARRSHPNPSSRKLLTKQGTVRSVRASVDRRPSIIGPHGPDRYTFCAPGCL